MTRHHRLLADGRARRVAATLFSLAIATIAGTPSCASDEVLGIDLGPDGSTTTSTIPDASPGADAASKCGNGVIDDGEGCDDGNTKDGDGCTATCVVESTPTSACPGTTLTLTAPTPTTRSAKVSGNTSANTPSFDSPSCGGGNGKDVVYAITPDVTGRARVTLDAKFDALLYARTACTTATSEISCKGVPVGGGKTEIIFPVSQGTTTWIVVDGLAGTSGAYDLTVEIGSTSCGDGIAQYPEQCDDGNTTAGDGCSATCDLETPMSAPGFCPGATFTLDGGKTISFGGDLTTLPKSTAGSLGCSTGSSGHDQVYAITPKSSGALNLELFAAWPSSLIHIRNECYTSSTEIDCFEQKLPGTPTKRSFPVVANQTYYVFVDARDAKVANGLYTLDVKLSAQACGNGTLETPEQCDDGNTADGDGCAADCTLEAMPPELDTCPGYVIPFSGPADGPMTYRATASTASLAADVRSCGGASTAKDAVYTFVAPFNGVLSGKLTSSFNGSIDVRTTCVAEGATGTLPSSVACGGSNGGDGEETVRALVTAGTSYLIIVEGENVNANNAGPYTIDLSLAKSVCGNGVIEGGEACDDSNTENGDGCDSTCTIEPTPSTRTTCANAEALALTETSAGVYTASATGSNWNLPGGGSMAFPCGVTSGKEAYFTVTPPIDGVVVAKTTGNYNISLGVRPACPPNTSTGFLTCSNKSAGGDEMVSFVGKANTKYWIIVDADSSRGSFTLDVTLQGESCGDGLVSGAEACDDGNNVAGDGCSPTCALEPLAGADACPGHAVSLTGTGTTPRFEVVTVSTSSFTNDYSGECEGSGREGVVAVTSDIAGTLTAQLSASWASVLYARSICSDSSTEVGTCKKFDPAKPNDTVRELTAPVVPGVPVFLFVDAIGSASGPASLSLTVTP